MRSLLQRSVLLIALLVVVTVASIRRAPVTPSLSPLEQLVRAAPRDYRRIEARLTGGFRWAPVRIEAPASVTPDDEELRLWGFAGEILRDDDPHPSAARRHLSGIASLVVGQASEAVAELEEAVARNPDDAAGWNDLAAARYTIAARSADPQLLPSALSAVDRALRLRPAFAEALFNRALILELLGLRREAEQAWQSAAMAERDPRWRAEAEEKRKACEVKVPPKFMSELEKALTRLTAGDRAPFESLIRARTEEAGRVAVGVTLSSWAEAELKPDAAAAAQALVQVRLVAAEIAKTNGDRFVQDVVSAIDAARPGTARCRRMAETHLAYREGRVDLSGHLPGSDEKLRIVADHYAGLGSPMEHVARYFAANALYESNRKEEARRFLERVLHDVDATRYPSLAAGAEKELGLYYGHRATWTSALRHMQRSQTIAERIGESANAAFAQAMVGEVYDRIGQPDNGWRNRSAALDVLTRANDRRSINVLIGGVHAETMRGDYDSALSLVSIALIEARPLREQVLYNDALIRQARVLLLAGRSAEARDVLAALRAVAAKTTNLVARANIEANVASVEAELLAKDQPCGAVAALDPAVSYYRANSIGMLLPPVYLQRGRAHLACGGPSIALFDFENGLAEIERQRENVKLDDRTFVFDTVPDLLGELVALLLAQHRDTEAFAVVERARARTLVEALGIPDSAAGASSATIARSLPPGTLLIEYVLLPHDVAAFCITQDGLEVTMLGVDPAVLRTEASDLLSSIGARRPRAETQQLSAKVYGRLFAPIAWSTGAADRLIIVPDRFLHALPFPGLFDAAGKRYLIEAHPLLIAPSGAFTLRRRSPVALSPALIISDPVGDADDPRLPAAREEATTIATLYDQATLLVGREATAERFVQSALRSHLIHYAGHAHEDDTTRGFLRFAAPPGADGSLDVTAITRLPLHDTRIVVLSACATMRGTAHVEGMPSIARAFLTAGVQSVVGMLWDIDDRSTAELVLRFHRELRDGQAPSAALRAAQCALLRDSDERLSHPAAWAAAELLGND